MSNFWIDVENASGIKQGDGPIISAEYWESVVRMDRAGSFSFSMPASDTRAVIVQPKLIARCYARVQDNVTEIGAGIIDKITLTVGAQGQTMLVVSGDDLLRELTNRSVGFLELTDGLGNGVTNALTQVMACAPVGWSLSHYISTANNVYAKFAGETVLSALIKIAADRGEHFRIGTGRSVAWLRKDFISSGIRAVQGGDPTAIDTNKTVCIVVNLQEERDTYQICSRIYPYGSGVGDARLTLAATSRTAPMGYTLDKANNYLENTTTDGSYGQIEQYMSFKDIAPISNTDADLQAAANKLFDAALVYLEKHKQPEKFYAMEVSKVDRLIYPGETVRVVVKKVVDEYDIVDIDADLYVLEVRNRIDGSGVRTTGMQVATVDRWNESDDALIVGKMDEARVMESYPQMNANAYTVAWYDDMDDSKSAYLDFWLGSEVVNVNQVLLRFQVDALRSTVKSVTGSSTSSGASNTTSSGASTLTSAYPSTKSTADAGGSISQDVNSYGSTGHNTGTENEYYDPISGKTHHSHGYSLIQHGHGLTVGAHGHGMNHTHGIDHTHSIVHTHTFTPNVAMVYGVFEDSSANKLREYSSTYPHWDLAFFINGTGIATSKITPVDGAAGWWYLDLTSNVSNSVTFRPLRGYNRLEVRAAESGAGRRARIRGQLTIRTVIHAVAIV